MFELKPMNKYVVIKTIEPDQKVAGGLLYAPGNVSNQYQLAKVLAVSSCHETECLEVGDTILYDTLGAVNHRIGGQTFTTVKAANILGVVKEKVVTDPAASEKVDPFDFNPTRFGGEF